MSIIFGMRRPLGHPVERRELACISEATESYAPDGLYIHIADSVGAGYQPYLTHERASLEGQPPSDPLGNFLVLDGRLDNHMELRAALGISEQAIPDSRIALSAYLRWGESCFSRFIGDWSLALWSAADRVMYLARDHAGTRSLYFHLKNGTLYWATYLETFLAAGIGSDLDELYAGRFLSALPIGDRTPLRHIQAVPPAHFLAIKDEAVRKVAHWKWCRASPVRCRSDLEYEEHFLQRFERSIERRLSGGSKILAELSGGMDSTSIVCVSDRIIKSDPIHAMNLIDTVSYFDSSEPSWDEEPYFSVTEANRGKQGLHIETPTALREFRFPDQLGIAFGRPLWPGFDHTALLLEIALLGALGSRSNRAILSGIGGDELLGGVPTPLPELADYVVSCQLRTLLRQTMKWCLASRTTLPALLSETLKFTLQLYFGDRYFEASIPPWIRSHPNMRGLLAGNDNFGVCPRELCRPSTMSSAMAWWSILETMHHSQPGQLARYEFRYPYLDRDLVEYLLGVPREQLLRPGRRRSLMRRALKGIVPPAVLERRRKGYIHRGPLLALERQRSEIESIFKHSRTADLGFIEPSSLIRAFEATVTGKDQRWWTGIARAIAYEYWLRGSKLG